MRAFIHRHPVLSQISLPVPECDASLVAWLAYIEQLHPRSVELGLDRSRRIYERLGIALRCPVFVVGGTNGKGSTCAMLDAILRAAGYRTGLYTSPHLIAFNERICIAGKQATDAELVRAFARIESARVQGDPVALTYFEFTTLACLLLFAEADLECAILEIGLGGRLDAVNILDADCAILTSIDLDHQDYLGDTREKIGWEKAHIFRPGALAVCADPQPPASVAEHAREVGARLLMIGEHFGYAGQHDAQVQQWKFWYRAPGAAPVTRNGLSYPALRGANQLLNASAAMVALEAMRDRLPVSMQAIREGLIGVEWPARFQILPGRPVVVLDVAHNPQAAGVLAENLSNIGFAAYTHAVFGMLADKDVAGVARLMRGKVDFWHLADLPGPRGMQAAELAEVLRSEQVGGEIFEYPAAANAYVAAHGRAGENDRILIFGSFLTVAGVMQVLQAPLQSPLKRA